MRPNNPNREPWWIFTTVKLVLVIKNNYDFTLVGLVRVSPRFGVMLFCMFLSVVFVMMDVIVTLAKLTQQSGINPYWRVSLSRSMISVLFAVAD